MNREILNHIDRGSTMAVIPARSGSKGIPDKNILNLGGYPLMAYSIIAALLCKNINRTIVSTDSQDYATIARKYGAETPFLRPVEISGDKATDLEFMKHLIQWLYENEGSVPEYYVQLRCTCPIRDPEIIDAAVNRIKQIPDATCLLSAYKAENILSPFKWLKLEDDIFFKSIFYDNNDDANMPRQFYPDTYIPSVYVDVLTTKSIVSDGLLHGNQMVAFLSPRTLDIDEPTDFVMAEKLISEEIPTIYQHLTTRFKTSTEEILQK